MLTPFTRIRREVENGAKKSQLKRICELRSHGTGSKLREIKRHPINWSDLKTIPKWCEMKTGLNTKSDTFSFRFSAQPPLPQLLSVLFSLLYKSI